MENATVDRRGFLKSLKGAVGWVATAAVAESAAGLVPAYRDQIPFIGQADAAGLGAGFRVDLAASAQHQAGLFPQSVAAGDPNPFGAVLWTRIDPEVAGRGRLIVEWQIATDPDFMQGSVVLQGLAAALASGDHTVKLPIQHPALRPFTTYYYRFIHQTVASRTGRFKTMPRPGDALAQLRVGYAVCQDFSNGYYTAYRYLAQEDVDVVVFLGDYIYEYRSDGTGGPDNGPVRVVPPYPSGADYPASIADYRHLYQTYRSDPDIQAMHERFAFIQLWDDHEFFNDCHQDFHEDTNPPGLSATSPQPELRQAANQAWAEHGLAAVPFNPNADWSQSVRLYRTFRFGILADIVVTDERLYRDGPPCGDEIGERYQTFGCAERTNPARTMLGAPQKEWFLGQVKRSTATWKLWANEVMLCQYRLPTPNAPADTVEFFDLDQWDGYPAERADILAQIRDAGVQNFVVLSGDAHLYLASYLRTDFDNPAEPPMGVELMVGAVSSGNYLDAAVDTPTATPLPNLPAGAVRAAQLGLPLDGLAPAILAYNPHMVFWNGSTWGYAVLTITPQSLVCDYRVVSTVKTPDGVLQQLASFTVPAYEVAISQTA